MTPPTKYTRVAPSLPHPSDYKNVLRRKHLLISHVFFSSSSLFHFPLPEYTPLFELNLRATIFGPYISRRLTISLHLLVANLVFKLSVVGVKREELRNPAREVDQGVRQVPAVQALVASM